MISYIKSVMTMMTNIHTTETINFIYNNSWSLHRSWFSREEKGLPACISPSHVRHGKPGGLSNTLRASRQPALPPPPARALSSRPSCPPWNFKPEKNLLELNSSVLHFTLHWVIVFLSHSFYSHCSVLYYFFFLSSLINIYVIIDLS